MLRFLLCLLLGLSALVPSAKADQLRLERLNLIFEGNESGAAFIRHCMKGKPAKASATFTKNSILATEALLHEMQAEYPELSNNQAIETLTRKQSEMRGPLDDFYAKNGCKTKQAIAAHKHFKTFNEWPADKMQGFLDNIENE